MAQNENETNPYSSWPAVSRTSRRATSSSMTHCFRYESGCHTRDNECQREKKKNTKIGIRGKSVHTFDSGIILVHKMTLDELDGEGRLSDTWAVVVTQPWSREKKRKR